MSTQVFSCSCNGTAGLDVVALDQVFDKLGKKSQFHSVRELCRRETMQFAKAVEGTDDVVVNCTQERTMFEEIAQAKRAIAPVHFVNTREYAAWGRDSAASSAKAAALLAMAQAAPMEPVSTVSYASTGRIAVVGPIDLATQWANRLHGALQVTALTQEPSALKDSPSTASLIGAARAYVHASASAVKLNGWLGAFKVQWSVSAPIDLEACVRCGACIEACPEGAISNWLSIDTSLCKSHRSCVAACDQAGAIDFARAEQLHEETFDLVLDLRTTAGFAQPQGYFWLDPSAPSDPVSLALKITQLVGEFEKPRFFAYKEKLCAHSRNEQTGCNKCIEVCSALAISSNGQGVKVNPHLCVGCGACSTVCPSGAMSYAYPSVPVLGGRLRLGLRAYATAGGKDAVILLHGQEQGAALLRGLSINRLAGSGPAAPNTKRGVGLPARVIPVALEHAASSGLDVWLAAVAYGAAQVGILLDDSQAPQYRAALAEQAALANQMLAGIGLGGEAVVLVEADQLHEKFGLNASRSAITAAATFQCDEDKRRTVESALEHLAKQANYQAVAPIALAAGSPFGAIEVNASACTLCLSCVSACPQGALLDNQETPQLRMIERNCVQCGLCETTCPENAITLIPQLDLRPSAREPRVLNEAKPFHCVTCNKAFGTAAMVETMLVKLAGHSMFSGDGLARLKMCADCRVIDRMKTEPEKNIFDFTAKPPEAK
jgi:heterodisulfide reductase subunit A-like polyferredoxin